MKKSFLCLIIFFTLMSQVAAESSGGFKKMDRYQLGNTGDVFMVEHAGWGLPSCPSARHARILRSDLNFDQLFSSIMLAYAADKKVIIYGNCDPTSTDHINLYYLLMEHDLTE